MLFFVIFRYSGFSPTRPPTFVGHEAASLNVFRAVHFPSSSCVHNLMMSATSSSSLFSIHKGPSVKVKFTSGGGGGSANNAISAPSRLCGICHQVPSSYVCPQCNVPYCNLKCYRGKDHLKCTENFYKRQVCNTLQKEPEGDDSEFLASLREQVGNTKRKEEEAEEEDDDDNNKEKAEAGANDDMSSSSNRNGISEVNKGRKHPHNNMGEYASRNDNILHDELDEDESPLIDVNHLDTLSKFENISLEDLTEAEKQHFFNSIHSGILAKDIDIWKPWWEAPTPLSNITYSLKTSSSLSSLSLHDEDGEDGRTSETNVAKAGSSSSSSSSLQLSEMKYNLLQDEVAILPGFSEVSKRPASPLMKYLLVDILFSYCYMMRIYNGDYDIDLISALNTLVSSSAVLKCDAKHESMFQVIHTCCELVANDKHNNNNNNKFDVNKTLLSFKDVCIILKKRKFVLCALADCRKLMIASNNISSKSAKKRNKPKTSSSSSSSTTTTTKSDMVGTENIESNLSRKLWFFMLWANGVGEHHFSTAQDELMKECDKYSSSNNMRSSGDDENENDLMTRKRPTNYHISNPITPVK
jgi:hypothetical protein